MSFSTQLCFDYCYYCISNQYDLKITKNLHESSDLLLRLQSIIDTAIDGIITISDRGIVESINPAAARLFGYSQQEVIGNNINMLMPSPDHEKHDTYISRYKDTREAKIIGIGREVKGRRKDGSIFPFRLAVSEVSLQEHRIFTGIIHDLSAVKDAEDRVLALNEQLEIKVKKRTDQLAETVNKLLATNQRIQHEIKERRAAEAALRKSLDRERELNELKSRFVSMASHEFRTPLSSILSSAELISAYTQTGQQEKREKHIKRIISSVKNMTGILNDFLSLSKLEEGITRMHPRTFLLKDLCEEIIDNLQNMLKPGQDIHHVSKLPDEPLFLDDNFLKNILFNLLSNAIKYSDEGSKIQCNAEIINRHLQLEVKDEGMGIPEEDQQHLFSRFFRANNAVNIKGTGLGLHIVKRYLELMHGTIQFSSQLGVGTTFLVKIPLNASKA
jgi:PAS domain S-box-containing protein